MLDLSCSEAVSRAAELLERFGLGEKRADYPDRLSGGQQRVAIVRAPAMRPRLLLLDEIVEQAPPARLFSDPSDERTRRFLRRIVDAGRM